jgi:hypothetical protein
MFVLFKFTSLVTSRGQPLPVHSLIARGEGILSTKRAALEAGRE